MSNFRRRLMMNVEKKYTPVEYLESTGTQYINTGLTSAVNTQIIAKINWTNVTKRQLFGANDGMYFGVVNGYWQLAQTGNSSSSLSVNINNWYSLNYKLSFNGTNYTNTLIVNDDIITYARGFASGKKIYLFTIGDTNDANNNFLSNCKLGSIVISQNDNIIRDYIPVLDSSSRPCLYDKVEGKFYYNQGTGEFLYE